MINGFYSAISYPFYMVNGFPNFTDLGMYIIIISESIFFIDIVLSFFKQELDEEGISKSEALTTISYKYLTNGFIIDFITFLPIGYFFQFAQSKLHFFWAIKAMRIRTLNI